MTCPPGVICVENFTMFFLLVFLGIGITMYIKKPIYNHITYTTPPPTTKIEKTTQSIPINIPTRQIDTTYKQIGILTRISGPEMILPLLGRPLYKNRNKWNFYAISNELNSIKLPISNGGRSCTSEYGCDDLYNGDTVFVEGYNDSFKVTRYENELPRYIPYL